jgi:phosphoglycolate phosphatase
MLADYGRTPLGVDTVRGYIGRGMANLVQRCFGEEPAPADAIEIFRQHYRACNGRTSQVYPGVVEGLNLMRAAGLPIACVTNKASVFVPPLLAASGLSGCFDQIVCGDTLARAKPDPLPLIHACEHFGVPPREALMIGDSQNDVRAARAAGCPIICVPYGYAEGSQVRAEDCDAIVPTLEAAARLLAPVRAPMHS